MSEAPTKLKPHMATSVVFTFTNAIEVAFVGGEICIYRDEQIVGQAKNQWCSRQHELPHEVSRRYFKPRMHDAIEVYERWRNNREPFNRPAND